MQSELFPEGKVAAVKNATEDAHQNQPAWDKVVQRVVGESMTRQVTMMVGDGVNDAPVLAVADIGMAMTDGTSTAASESAQVVIMNDDIASVPRAIAIARRTKKVMLQAVLVGLGLAIIGMVAAAFNLIPVVVGAFMQERSTWSASCGRSPPCSTASSAGCGDEPCGTRLNRVAPCYIELGEISPAMFRRIHMPKSAASTPCDSRNMIFAYAASSVMSPDPIAPRGQSRRPSRNGRAALPPAGIAMR